MDEKPKLMLGSASPRRRELLGNVGCVFEVEVADIDESIIAGEQPLDYVARVARAKADHLSIEHRNHAILTADTVVASDAHIFAKPEHREDAFEMWRQLSDGWHQVSTAVCLLYRDFEEQVVVSTQVRFAAISDEQMLDYWQSGEPQDKAGGYAIQGLASAWVQEVRGSYSNVVGLPLFETNKLLRRVGHNWL